MSHLEDQRLVITRERQSVKESDLGSCINLDENIVEKPFFGRKCSDSDYSLEYFCKVRENGGPCIRFHSS